MRTIGAANETNAAIDAATANLRAWRETSGRLIGRLRAGASRAVAAGRRDRQRRRLLPALQDEDGARRGDALDARELLAQERMHRVGVGHADLEQVAVLAGDVVDLEHFGQLH